MTLSLHSHAYTPASTVEVISEMRNSYVRQIPRGRESRLRKTQYKMLNLNLGLMRFLVFGFEITVPGYNQRSLRLKKEMGDYLKFEKPDFVTFQELWHEREGEVIEELAREHGYRVVSQEIEDFHRHKHGLEILIKNDVIDQNEETFFSAEPFQMKAFFEKFKFKGILSATFIDHGKRKITIANTHLTPVHGETNLFRTSQIGEVVKYLDKNDSRLVFLGTDLNASHSYWERKPMNQSETEHWNRNAYNYETLVLLGKLWDLGSIGGTPAATFSLTENTVADKKYGAGGEPNQVLDYIFLRSTKGSIKLLNYSRAFDKPIVDEDGSTVSLFDKVLQRELPLYLSDHFGITAKIEIHQ